ncbi:hypothetical protein HQ29_05345 [Porphyromonas canoris]|nr:hypothetical protein HQ29_05345 [Porphyromonas canoris]
MKIEKSHTGVSFLCLSFLLLLPQNIGGFCVHFYIKTECREEPPLSSTFALFSLNQIARRG